LSRQTDRSDSPSKAAASVIVTEPAATRVNTIVRRCSSIDIVISRMPGD